MWPSQLIPDPPDPSYPHMCPQTSRLTGRVIFRSSAPKAEVANLGMRLLEELVNPEVDFAVPDSKRGGDGGQHPGAALHSNGTSNPGKDSAVRLVGSLGRS